jgi:hypothetical protein
MTPLLSGLNLQNLIPVTFYYEWAYISTDRIDDCREALIPLNFHNSFTPHNLFIAVHFTIAGFTN